MPWNVNNIKVWAEVDLSKMQKPEFIDDSIDISVPVKVDVGQISASFPMNSIPKATLLLAVGRRADDITQVATIHKIVNGMKFKLPVIVYATVDTTSADQGFDVWPENPDGTPAAFKIFDGLTTGSGFRKTFGGAEFTLHLTHWLDNLNYSSATSRLFQPLNPSQYSWVQAVPNFNTALYPANLVPLTAAQNLFSAAAVATDFWGYIGQLNPVSGQQDGGLKLFFQQLCGQDLIMAVQIRNLVGFNAGDEVVNIDALSALSRIEPIAGITATGYEFGVPVNIDLTQATVNNQPVDAAVNLKIASMIAAMIMNQSFEMMSSTTIWDKLVGDFAPQFLLSVIPMIDRALVVPFIPGLRTAYTTITADSYDFIQVDAEMPRMIRGVALMVGASFLASEINRPVYNVCGGLYAPQEAGQILMRSMPIWLGEVWQAFNMSNLTIPTDNIAVANALAPAQIGQNKELNAPALFEAIGAIWNNYARCVYMAEILRGRRAQISGKLRFDIAPGSTVKIEASKEPFINDDQIAQDLYGTVVRVSYSISAEAQKCGTAFDIAHIRTEAENDDDSFSIDKHPLWQRSWAGAPLSTVI